MRHPPVATAAALLLAGEHSCPLITSRFVMAVARHHGPGYRGNLLVSAPSLRSNTRARTC